MSQVLLQALALVLALSHRSMALIRLVLPVLLPLAWVAAEAEELPQLEEAEEVARHPLVVAVVELAERQPAVQVALELLVE